MSLQSFLEKDEDKLKQALKSADTLRQCVPVLEHETDRLLYLYNEENPNDDMRLESAGLMRQIRTGCALTDCGGEVSVFVSAGSGQNAGGEKPTVLITAGIVCLAAVLVLALPGAVIGTAITRLFLYAVFLTAGGICLFLAGKKSKKTGSVSGTGTYITQTKPDVDKIYSVYRAMILTADRTLKERNDRLLLESHRRFVEAGRNGQNGTPFCDKDLDIISGLLEASCSGDGDYALTKAEQLRFRLHEEGIETVDYSDGREEWFDLLPADRTQTLRPALVKDGRLLKKGLAGIR